MVYVKICGITSSDDIAAAVAAGADALGFLVGLAYATEDQLSPERAAELARSLPPFVSPVLVTHRDDRSEVRELCAAVPATHLQLHGDFPIEEIPPLREALPHLKILKAVHVTGTESIDLARVAARYADALVLDTRTADRLGGTGVVHDWSISRAIRDTVRPCPVVLAGGLTPENVLEAIEKVRPFAVDVNSGVAVRPGVKDRELVARFVAGAKSAAA